MRRDYDIFEKFPDGSTLWRASARGRFEAQRTIAQLAELSENEFFMIDIPAGEHIPYGLPRPSPQPSVKRAAAG